MHGSYKWIIMLIKCGRLNLTVFYLIRTIGTYGNWKNQNPGGCFGATSKTALPIHPFYHKNGPNGLNCQFLVAPKWPPGFCFFQLSWVPNLHFSWKPLLPNHPKNLTWQLSTKWCVLAQLATRTVKQWFELPFCSTSKKIEAEAAFLF